MPLKSEQSIKTTDYLLKKVDATMAMKANSDEQSDFMLFAQLKGIQQRLERLNRVLSEDIIDKTTDSVDAIEKDLSRLLGE